MIEIGHWPNGNIRHVLVKNEDGELHNTEGPAVQRWHKNGQERWRYYYVNGGRHRLDGLAHQSWYEDGREERHRYCVDGKDITEEEFKVFQDSVEVTCQGKTVRILKTQAIKLGLVNDAQ